MKKTTNKFRNMTILPSGNYQLKFKKERQDYQLVAGDLKSALKARNKVYLTTNYRPNFLFVKFFDLTVLADDIGTERSGNIYHRFQVHSRLLSNRKYRPKSFRSKVDAEYFTKKWLISYNKIAAVYNGWRELAFLQQIELEVDNLTPAIETKFDEALWNKAAKEVFGNNIPKYYEGESH
ncbi:hypothetical protein OH460_08660 [Vibrio sp. Makdt]|uniref:hypothetical protein n=1 Tax=Vibrio sp. Makdt TaxID=2998828 RepID=UPI0022CDAA34|nr:hypothetical protein [Vibrio sp. Makdt]MDA0152372.1 hypothetical protein [Vibrio sp. Makdt]